MKRVIGVFTKCLAAAALLGLIGPVGVLRAADGIAASIAHRYSKDANLVPESWHVWHGKLVLFHIQNNKTTKCDTLYKGLAAFPAFNTYGDKIVFWREGDTLINNKLVSRPTDHLSVINVDGTGLRDLLEFTGTLSQNLYYKDSYDRQCQWPKGDWIYYVYPKTVKIYRVNVNDPSKNEFIFDYIYGMGGEVPGDVWIRRWTMDAAGKHTVFQFNPGSEYLESKCYGNGAQYYMEFPALPDPCATGISGYLPGCNPSISPSAKFGTHYGANGHTCAGIHGLNWTTHTIKTEGVRHKNTVCIDSIGLENGYTCDQLPHCAPGGYYGGCEWIRWSKNSDKWYNHSCGYLDLGFALRRLGSNQYIVNWYDRELIRSSNNPKNLDSGRTTISYGNDPGDFFLYGGPAGTIEDTLGKWVPIDNTPVSNVRVAFERLKPSRRIQIGAAQISADFPPQAGPFRVTLYNSVGRQLDHRIVERFPVALRSPLPPGAYYVRVAPMGTERTVRGILTLQ